MPTRTDKKAAAADDAEVKALDAFLKRMDKERPGEVLRLDDDKVVDVDVIPTGALSLDVALGVGGFPRGRIVELFGPYMSGKTSVALSAASNCQAAGGNVGFIDSEHALNKDLAIAMGVDLSRIVLYQPNSGEEAIDMVEKMLTSRAFDMVIVDSVAAMVPQAEIDAEIDQQHMALHARLMSKFMRRVAGPVSDSKVCLVLINQIRKNLGAYGAPDVTTGGQAIPFYSSVRVEVRSSPSKKIERGSGANKEVVGQEVKCTVKKNKLAAPFKVAEFDLMFGEGIAAGGSLLAVCRELGIITNSGAYYTNQITGEMLGQGGDKVKARIDEDPELATQLTNEVYLELDRRRRGVRDDDTATAGDTENSDTENSDVRDLEPVG